VGGTVLEVTRFEDLLADHWEDLREEVLDVLLGDDFGYGAEVELFEDLDELFEDGQGLVLGGDGVHVGSRHLLGPLLLRDVLKRIS
jgi:hypothetical protein